MAKTLDKIPTRKFLLGSLLLFLSCGNVNLHAQMRPPGMVNTPQLPYAQPPITPLPPAPVLGPPGVFVDRPQVYTIRDYSWHYIAAPQPREIRVQDLVTILVKEISEASVDSRFDRQRRSTLLAELKEFIRLDDAGRLVGAAANEPTIDANLSKRLNSNGQVNEKEEVTYRIAATVVDVLPNGNLVLEAKKTIQSNKEIWTHSLTGIIRSQDINRDNTALSENIANLQISKSQSGKVYDSTKRPWGSRLYDLLFPF